MSLIIETITDQKWVPEYNEPNSLTAYNNSICRICSCSNNKNLVYVSMHKGKEKRLLHVEDENEGKEETTAVYIYGVRTISYMHKDLESRWRETIKKRGKRDRE